MAGRDGSRDLETVRLNKYLARAGFGSRRSVEHLVTAGRVTLNGEVVRDMGRQIVADRDQVAVDGSLAVLPRDHRVYAFHKPQDVVSTLAAQGGQPSLLPYRLQSDIPDRFMPVGRLDSETTGLLLWTDDGMLNQAMCRPESGLWKTYEVDLNGELDRNMIKTLTKGGVMLDGRPCRPCRLVLRPNGTTRHWVIEIHEGRRRQIRRMFQAVGLKVVRLQRTAIGPIKLGILRPGDFRRLDHSEVEALRGQVAVAE